MKKLNLFLLILVLVLGTFILVKQFLPSGSDEPDTSPTVEKPSEIREVGLSEPKPVEETKMSELELHKHIKNKRYLENTYMALEYSKVNNAQLVNTLKSYLDDNTKMKPEDVVQLIEIHEKTFLNRYLKVFVSAPDSELQDLNAEMRRIFYQMKVGFDSLRAYGAIPVQKTTTNSQNGDSKNGETQQQNGNGNNNQGLFSSSNQNSQQPTNNNSLQPSIQPPSKPAEPNYDLNDLRVGIQQLEKAYPLVDEALKKLGQEDIKIEKKWVEAGISESDLLEVMDKTNIANPELSEKPSIGQETPETREDSLSKLENNNE